MNECTFVVYLVLIPVKAGRQLEIGKFSYSLYFCFSLSPSLSLSLLPSVSLSHKHSTADILLFHALCKVQDRTFVLTKMQNTASFLPQIFLYFSETPLEAHQCSINYPAKDREKRTPSIHKVMHQEILSPYWCIPRTSLCLLPPTLLSDSHPIVHFRPEFSRPWEKVFCKDLQKLSETLGSLHKD